MLAGGVAQARTLALSVTRLDDPQVSAQSVRIVIDERADGGSLHLEAARIGIPLLALDGRLDWACPLLRSSDALSCTGPVALTGGNEAAQTADLALRVASGRIELEFEHDGSQVGLTIPMAAAGEIEASLHDVPAGWLESPLAQLWKNGELRDGVFDVQAKIGREGGIAASYRATRLAFNTFNGTLAGAGVAVSGHVEGSAAASRSWSIDADFAGGSLQLGVLHVALPDAPVVAHLDVDAEADGRWHVGKFTWSDPQTLVFEASGELDPSALAPLRQLDLHVEQARFPLAAERYARGWPALRGLALRGDLAGDVAVDGTTPTRVSLATDTLDVDDGAGHAVRGLRGAIDWSAQGERPSTTLAWTSARIGDLTLGAIHSRWQSKQGSLHLLGSLETRVLGGKLRLEALSVNPAFGGSRASTRFAFSGIDYDSKDGSLAASQLAADGTAQFDIAAGTTRVRADAAFHGGEMLAGAIYVKLPATPVRASLDASLHDARWQVDAFDWNDPGVLDLHAEGGITPAQAKPMAALKLELRDARLGPALDRYAHGWLASKGYGELTADGALSGSLQFDADGLQGFAFAAKQVSLHDGAGRFAIAGIDGSVDWNWQADTPPSSLGWTSLELFTIPLGAASAQLETRQQAIVLAQPLAIDVLGGKIRLEKMSLQPRSPRGERYAASFAIAGVDMAQLSDAFGWPRFGGNLSGGIPEIELAGNTIEFHGGLDLYVFDGHLGVSGLALQRPFGVAPSLAADVHFENFDLEQVTHAFSLGGMSGRLTGTVGQLQLVDWSPVAFDAWLRTNGGGRMSYKAVNDITSIAGGGGLSADLQTMALKVFDTFGYRRLGLRCKLSGEVCLMGGIDPVPDAAGTSGSADDSYAIVEGSGLPRIEIVGHRRRVDWPTLVRRLQEATHGQGPVIH